MILSQSAHLYRDTWEWAQAVTEKYLTPYRHPLARLDPRGNFLISIDNEEIVVEHTGPGGGESMGTFRGKSGLELRETLVKENVISSLPHALDIGLELMKAETALKLGISYEQDNPLQLGEKAADAVAKHSKQAEPPLELEAPASEEPAPSEPEKKAPRIIKPGIGQTENQRRLYPKILRQARIDSMISW